MGGVPQPSQGIEAVFNQLFHGMEFIHHALADRRGCGQGLGLACGGRFGRRGGNIHGNTLCQRGRAGTLWCGRCWRWQGLWGTLCCLVPAAQHAFAHIVLERKRAHGQLLRIFFHFAGYFLVAGGGAGAAWCCLQLVGRRGGAPVQAGQGVLGGGHYFHTVFGGTVGQDQCALAKGQSGLGQGFTGGCCGKALDVHGVAPRRIGPMRMVWVSGISLWASTCRRGATRRTRREIAPRIGSGTSRQAGTPISSCFNAVSAAVRVSMSATPGSSAGPEALPKACTSSRSRLGSIAMTLS